jgi:DNA repair exonuclease SbcCD nuclease subunit
MKFIHTADLQIGARFTQFGEKADTLRAARISTLKRILEIAKENDADGLLIAGDMFESNQIATALVSEAFDALAACPEIPVVILPGNHDPLDGPGCIWMRKPFASPPAHITVCVSRDPLALADAMVLPVPITQKVSAKDPSLPLVDIAAAIAADKIKIGMTHGALAIEGKHQPNDQPIALNAATRAGLDYLAVGHWHKPQVYDDGRLAMPGTPEPDDFDQDSGSVSLVEISAPGERPTITHIDSATFSWRSVTVDLLQREPTPDIVNEAISGSDASPDSTALRIELVGPVSPEHRDTLSAAVAQATEDCAVVIVEDKTSTVLSEHFWNACLQEHPLLAQVVADVERSRLFTTGSPPTIETTGLDDLTLDEFQSLCAELNIEADRLRDGAFEAMMGLLAAEVGKAMTGGGAA